MHTAEMHTHTEAVLVWAHGNKDGNAYIVYTIQWHMRAWGCIYQMSVYTIYGDKGMHMHSCSLFSFCLFCLFVELLQNYQIQPPGEPFWPRFHKSAPALPA